jgi:hypothetical protein
MGRIKHPGRSIGGDFGIIDFPSRVVVPLFEDGINLTISPHPIVLSATSPIPAESGGQGNEAKATKKSVHDGEGTKITHPTFIGVNLEEL